MDFANWFKILPWNCDCANSSINFQMIHRSGALTYWNIFLDTNVIKYHKDNFTNKNKLS